MTNRIIKRVALAIPFYNEEKSIYKTLSSFSLLLREFSDSFFVLVDNNSRDRSLEVINRFTSKKPNVKVIVDNEKRQGVKFARKKALELASGLEPDIIFSTDADTTFNHAFIKVFLKEIKTFFEQDFDVFVGEGMLDTGVYIRRMIIFSEFVEMKRHLWNLYYRLFGPYFFGAFFGIKNSFYKKISPYYRPEDFPIPPKKDEGEDFILSKRAYFMEGKFFFTKKSYIITSPRRFLNDPEQWVTGSRQKNFREEKQGKINSLQKAAADMKKRRTEINRKVVENASDKIWRTFLDTYGFCQKSNFKYKNATHSLNEVSRLFNFPLENGLNAERQKLFKQKVFNYIKNYLNL